MSLVRQVRNFRSTKGLARVQVLQSRPGTCAWSTPSLTGHVTRGIAEFGASFQSFCVSHVGRQRNNVAHHLARIASADYPLQVWLEEVLLPEIRSGDCWGMGSVGLMHAWFTQSRTDRTQSLEKERQAGSQIRTARREESEEKVLRKRGYYKIHSTDTTIKDKKKIMKKYNLREKVQGQHQTYALGIKEVWEIDSSKHEPGHVLHTLGWPLDNKTHGGSFLYHTKDRQAALSVLLATLARFGGTMSGTAILLETLKLRRRWQAWLNQQPSSQEVTQPHQLPETAYIPQINPPTQTETVDSRIE
ncbi:hypothetical protein TEA_028765 [Camellia sinensis var. sinensis]|uniref:Electron transfer flavoprotein-ubiquinone oxidoreductase n=1 Tax=Camellia sinensis var. sinensis TaxID=542762 RepID=A0A4S4ETJ7_CAMSN|nr:hypothetical protein TEA_028765 [Camellia sinensis var. sinensis]